MIDTVKRNFVLSRSGGPIVVQFGSGYTIYTNHLAWADAQREISTEEPVMLAGHGMEVHGRGLIGKLDTEEFKVLEDVQVDFQ